MASATERGLSVCKRCSVFPLLWRSILLYNESHFLFLELRTQVWRSANAPSGTSSAHIFSKAVLFENRTVATWNWLFGTVVCCPDQWQQQLWQNNSESQLQSGDYHLASFHFIIYILNLSAQFFGECWRHFTLGEAQERAPTMHIRAACHIWNAELIVRISHVSFVFYVGEQSQSMHGPCSLFRLKIYSGV